MVLFRLIKKNKNLNIIQNMDLVIINSKYNYNINKL